MMRNSVPFFVVGVLCYQLLISTTMNADAACATVASSGKCASCSAGTFGELCTRNFSNKSTYSLLLPELIILCLLILLFVVVWAVFIWFVIWGWEKKAEEETGVSQPSKTSTTTPADEPLTEVVTEASARQVPASQHHESSSQSQPQSQPQQCQPQSHNHPAESTPQPHNHPAESTPQHTTSVAKDDEDGSPQSLRVSYGVAGNHEATPRGGDQRAPEPQMLHRTPDRAIHRDVPVQSSSTPISPSPIQPRSRQQDAAFTPPRRDDSPPRRAPSHTYNPQQQQYRSMDPSTRHGDSNPFASELQRNLSPTRPRASRALAAPPTETTPGSHCPYGSSSQGGNTNVNDVDDSSPYRHAHHPHAHDDVARGGVRGPYSDTRVDAARRHEAYDPHRPPADTKVDLTLHTQGGSRNGPPGGRGTQRTTGINGNTATGNNNINQSPRDVNYRSQTASPNVTRSQPPPPNDSSSSQQLQWDHITSNANPNRSVGRGQQQSQHVDNSRSAPIEGSQRRRSSQGSVLQTQSSNNVYPPPPSRGGGQSAAAPTSTSSSSHQHLQQQHQDYDSRQLFGGDQQAQQVEVSMPPSGGSSVSNYPTTTTNYTASAHPVSHPPHNDHRSNNEKYPPAATSSRRSGPPQGGSNSHPTSSNPPSTLFGGGNSHANTPAAAALSQWPAVSIQQQTSAPTSTSYSGGQPQQNYTHNASRRVDQSNQQQQGYVSKKPAPLVEDEVYPNVPTDPTFMNGLSRRSRSRGPGGGRRKSVGEEDAHITSINGYGGSQQHTQQQQQQVYQDPNQRSLNNDNNNVSRDTGLNDSTNVSGRNMTRRYPAEQQQQQQQQPPAPYNPPVRAASVHFPPETTTPSSRNYSQTNNNSRQHQQNTSYTNNNNTSNNRSESNMSTFGDNPRQRGRMSVFPAPPRMEPNSSRAESHYDLPSSRSHSHF